jgi:hypothetical protein
MCLVLHPRHKTSYFTKAGWLSEWIRTAEDLARAEWQAYKPTTPISTPAPASVVSNNVLNLLGR